MAMSDRDENAEWKRTLRDLDGILPEGIDRRTFFKSTAATLAGGMLAGCTGGTGGGDDGGDGGDIMAKNIIWRQPWKAEPAWAPAFIADLRGYWIDAGVSPPSVLEGFGSPDTARRVGTGKEEIGHASISSVVPGLAQGFNLTFVGMTKQRSFLGLFYREDRVDDPTSLEGKRVGLDSGIGQSTWPLWVSLFDMDASQIQTTAGEGTVLFNQFGSGDLDAVWSTLDEVGVVRNVVPEGVTVGAEALYNHLQVPGYPLFVNTNWYEETSDGTEYVTRLLEGYSEATKWWLLNPGEMIDLLRNDINESLQATERSELIEINRFNVAYTVSEVTDENGLGYMSKDVVENAINQLGQHLVDDPSTLPGVDDVTDTTPSENADLAILSDDERQQIIEYAGDAWDLYQ